ncbi:MAG: hypothetical protein WAO52_01735 [Prolixibacteraceae bacterium]
MKYFILTILLLGTTLMSHSIGKEDAFHRTIGVSAQMELFSKSVWHGWDLSDNKPAYIPYMAIDLFQTGFELAYWASIPTDQNLKVNEIAEFYLKYHDTKMEGSPIQFNFHSFVDYIRASNNNEFPYSPFPNPDDPNGPWIQPFGMKQLWKLNLGVSLDKLIPLAGSFLVPAVDMFYITPAGDAFFTDGRIWEFSLNYSQPISQKLNYGLKFNAIYHDKIFDVSAWGAYVFSTSWRYAINNLLTFQAGINYQISPEAIINPENEFWGQAGMAVSF